MPRPAKMKDSENVQEMPHVAAVVAEWPVIDWEALPMLQAEAEYQRLRKEFERAGRILNARHTEERRGMYECTICKSKHEGLPAGQDLSWKNPKTGLIAPVRCCSEQCWLTHQRNQIELRRSRNVVQ